MHLTVVGMSSRDAHVFDLFMRRYFPAWHWSHLAASREIRLGNAKRLVLDLAAHGLAQGSQSALLRLCQLVGDRPVVLLVSGRDQTWADMAEAQQKAHWLWLPKPYGAERMREALNRLRTLEVTSSAATSASIPVDVVAPKEVAPVPERNEVHSESTRAAPTLDVDELASLLTGTPPERFTLLRQLLVALRRLQPFEVRFTVQNSLIIHPLDAWVATNTPLQVISRVCDSNALAAAVSIRDMDPADAEDRAHRLGMSMHELNVFLYEISSALLTAQLAKSSEATP